MECPWSLTSIGKKKENLTIQRDHYFFQAENNLSHPELSFTLDTKIPSLLAPTCFVVAVSKNMFRNTDSMWLRQVEKYLGVWQLTYLVALRHLEKVGSNSITIRHSRFPKP